MGQSYCTKLTNSASIGCKRPLTGFDKKWPTKSFTGSPTGMPTLHWIGKDKVINHHREVPFKVLEHAYGFSAEQGKADAPTGSGNMVVHGDNLEALKALLPRYEGRVKCIYIDPPYNTGNEGWVYNDNVNDPKIRRWLHQVVGKEGEDLSRHDKWLCMMYPRLVLLHKLLAEDGVIWVSIDDTELANLKCIMDEIFGPSSMISNVVWNSRKSVSNDAIVSLNHNHTLVYTKDIKAFYLTKSNFKLRIADDSFANPDNDPRGPWKADPFDSPGIRPNLTFEIVNPNTGKKYLPPNGRCWRTGPEEYAQFVQDNRIVFGKKGVSGPQLKRFLAEAAEKGQTPTSLWNDVGTATNATQEVMAIFGDKIFETPKPSTFIERIIQLSTDPNAIILDSFAGSGTTAHAVLNLNKQDGGNRKFILVEMEDYAETITAERVRRVMQGYGSEKKKVAGTGGAFDYYTLGPRLFDAHHNLNEEVAVEKIREYVWYTETRTDIHEISGQARNDKRKKDTPYLLGTHEDTAYYFVYEKERLTVLDYDTLALLKTKAAHYVIYADNCILPQHFLEEHHITFKKIPRDISRF